MVQDKDGGVQALSFLMGEGGALLSSDVNDLFAGLDSWWVLPTQNDHLTWATNL
jgi:hypothetical protein